MILKVFNNSNTFIPAQAERQERNLQCWSETWGSLPAPLSSLTTLGRRKAKICNTGWSRLYCLYLSDRDFQLPLMYVFFGIYTFKVTSIFWPTGLMTMNKSVWLHTVSDISQPLEHVLIAAVERVFRTFQQLQLDACTRSLPANPAGALHSPECNHHLPFRYSLAVLLWGSCTVREKER